MSSLKWEIIHECDDEDGNPTQWASEINHPKYGKYCWISNIGKYFSVEVDCGGFKELAKCKSLTSAKRWVSTQLMKNNLNGMKKYIFDDTNSEIDFYIIYDNKGNTYEYHPDTQDVFVINRYEEDEGEKAKEDIVREIRKFCNALK